MVNLIIDRYDIENNKEKVQEMIMNQVKQICKKLHPDNKFKQIRIIIGAKTIKTRDTYY